MDADTELVHKAQTGDSQAANELISRYTPIAHKIVVRKVPEMDADDVAQEILLNAYNSLNSFRFESSFITWFTRIAANKTADYFRAAFREKKVIEPLIDKTARMRRVANTSVRATIYSGQVPYTLINQFEYRMTQENISAQEHFELEFSDMMANLPGNYQEILRMYILEDYTMPEIAQMLGRTYSSAWSLYRRAIARLRHELA